MNEILKINKLSHAIKKQKILKNMTFSITRGSFCGFIGENGAGKTTTMCFISSILNDYSGEIFFEDKLITEHNEKSILFIPERINFSGHFTAFQFVEIFASIFLGKKANIEKINNLFEKFEITDIKDRKANKLSSGQKNKISLICAIVSKFRLLLIDEPATNLDPTSRIKLFNSFQQLNRDGTTIMISSNIISELEKYVDSSTFIKKGKVIWMGELKDEKLSKKHEEIDIWIKMKS